MLSGSALLAHRRIFWIAVAVGMLLALTTLRLGFVLDDYGFVAWLDGPTPKPKTPFDLYEFADGDRAGNFQMLRSGPWPWWTDLDLKVRFFRPLSSGLLALDHKLFGHAPLGYHVHALVWYFLLLVGVGLVLRCVLSPRIFALAFLLFAVNGGHAEAVGWIASRHMLVAGVPALLGFAAHLYYRERGFRAGRWLSILGVAIGLMGGEAALTALFYWFSYEAIGSPGASTWRERARRVAVPIGILVTYFAAYKAAGYGAANNDAYFEPTADLGRFAAVAAVRFPMLLGELVGGSSSELALVTSVAPFVIAGLVSLAAISALARAVWPFLATSDRRALGWLVLGAVLATLMTVGGYPGARLLLYPRIGGCALLAALILTIGARLADVTLGGAARGALRFGRGVLVVVHLVLAPLMFLATVDMLGKMGASDKVERTVDSAFDSAPLSGKAPHVYVLAASDPAGGIYAGAARAVRAPQTAASWVVLSMAKATHHIERTGDRTFVISVDGGMLHGSFEVVFRSAHRPLRPGDRVDLDDITITVLEVQGSYPTSFEVAFRAMSIDDPRLRFFVWRDERLAPVRLGLHERIDVPWSAGPTGFF